MGNEPGEHCAEDGMNISIAHCPRVVRWPHQQLQCMPTTEHRRTSPVDRHFSGVLHYLVASSPQGPHVWSSSHRTEGFSVSHSNHSIVMHRILRTLYGLFACAALSVTTSTAQTLQYPILFVTAVPTPLDSATQSSMFANHVGDMPGGVRGGDLWIRYTDGSLRNLTQSAGFGVSGLQGTGAIAVREPSVHWSGTKGVFSMVVGGATRQGDTTQFYWQIYEISSFGQGQTPVITRVPNQPSAFNNVSPIYGTDDRIIFTSDRPRNGGRYLYPAMDEYKGAPTNTGLWSLDPSTGDLVLLDNSPSGDFSPIIDSYGRLLIMRWDRLQRDRNADIDALGTGVKGTFNYTDESPNAIPQYNVRTESFPEPQGQRTDLLSGTNMVGFEFNQFFPWQINEDGTSPETINHLGRHEMRQVFNRSITDDSNVVNFNVASSNRANRNVVNNFTQVREDPNTPGLYYGVDAFQSGTHSGGQILALTAAPSLDPNQTAVTYVTDRSTATPTFPGQTPNPNHSGMYRNPLPTSNGTIVAAHSVNTFTDANQGTPSNPVSRYSFRLKTLRRSGNVWVADSALTAGISKALSYWDPNVQVSFSGTLWELDPVEVRPRTRPSRRYSSTPSIEQSVFVEEGVAESLFRAWMADNGLAVAVSRDITHRDAADHQQPYYLRVAGTSKQTPNASGKIYDVSHMQFYQGDYIRGSGLTSPGGTPHAGRRVLAVPMHLPAGTNPDPGNGPAGSVRVGSDGSVAAFVPSQRPMTWQLTTPTAQPVVRERYWVTFQPGEIRVCASCHGTNDGAPNPINPIPQNKPEAFRELLRGWKAQVIPSHVSLLNPANDTLGAGLNGNLVWLADAKSSGYRVQLSRTSDFASTITTDDSLNGTSLQFTGLEYNTVYYWRVQGRSKYGDGEWSDVWRFTTGVAAPVLRLPANQSTGQQGDGLCRWMPVSGAVMYRIQLSAENDFATTIIDQSDLTTPSAPYRGLSASTTYYWRVQAIGGGGPGEWSETWRFTIAAKPDLLAPMLSLPVNGADSTSKNLSLVWRGEQQADAYHAQLALSSDFSSPILDQSGITDTLIAASGLADSSTYYWRVAWSGAAGTSPWSDVWSFRTAPPPVQPTSVNDPTRGVTGGLWLSRNLPDPFSDRTIIRFGSDRPASVALRLYDTRGAMLATLYSGRVDAEETTIELTIGTGAIPNLAPGTYLLRLEGSDARRELVIHVMP